MRPGAPGWTRAWELSHPKSRMERATSERSRRNGGGGPNERCLAGSMGAINVHHPYVHHPFTHNPSIHNPFTHYSIYHPSILWYPKGKDIFGLCSSENQTMPWSICNPLKTETEEKWHGCIPKYLDRRWSGAMPTSEDINLPPASQLSLLIYAAGTCAQNLLLLYYIKHCNFLRETFWC